MESPGWWIPVCCLEAFPETTPDKGRLVRGAAQHCLAQLYLDKGIALDEEGRVEEARTS